MEELQKQSFPRTAGFIWKWYVPASLFIVELVCMNEPLWNFKEVSASQMYGQFSTVKGTVHPKIKNTYFSSYL